MLRNEVFVCIMIDNYLAPMLDIEISYEEVEKLFFFFKQFDENLNLKFNIENNFPTSQEVNKLLDNMVAKNMIKVFVTMESRTIEFVNDIALKAHDQLKTYDQETKDIFKKIENLMYGFESQYGLKLLSAVYILKYLKNKDINYICNATKFARQQVQIAIAHLNKFF